MKILAIGDFHGIFPKNLKEKVSEVDLILCTGDYGDTSLLRELEFKNWNKFRDGKTLEDIVGKNKMKTIMKRVVNTGDNVINSLRLFNTPIITIYGNSDTLNKDAKKYNLIGLESKFKKFNFKLLKNNYLKLNNLIVAGFSGYRGAMSKGLSKMDNKKENKLIKFNNQWDIRLNNLFNKIGNYSNVLFFNT
jgi:predicted phosphodiesterase